MGGGKANRVAGNVKPTSSGRISELLEGHPPVITFSALSDDNDKRIGDVAFKDSDDFHEDELRLIWKRLGKKDCVTRIKAMRDLADYLSKKPDDDDDTTNLLVPVLPHWCKQFARHAIDNDWQLRDATFDSHEKFALKLRRNLAPYLKQLMPVWIAGQFDPCSPVSRSARKSFNQTFSQDKQIEAMLFCQADIIDYARTMIFDGPDKTLFPSDAVQFRELHERLIASCLSSVTAIVSAYSNDSRSAENIITTGAPLVLMMNNEKFWKLSRHSNNSIRATFYRLLTFVAQKLPFNEFLTEFSIMKFYQVTLGKLKDKNHNISIAITDTVIQLYTCATNLSPWTMINFKSTFLPLLLSAVRDNIDESLFRFLITFFQKHNFHEPNLNCQDVEFFKQLLLSVIEGIKQKPVKDLRQPKQSTQVNLSIAFLTECMGFLTYQFTFETEPRDRNELSIVVSKAICKRIELLWSQPDIIEELFEYLTYLLIITTARVEQSHEERAVSLRDSILDIMATTLKKFSSSFLSMYEDAHEYSNEDPQVSSDFLRAQSLRAPLQRPELLSSRISNMPTLEKIRCTLSENDLKLAAKQIKDKLYPKEVLSQAASKILSRCDENPTFSAFGNLVEMLKIDVGSCLGGRSAEHCNSLWLSIKHHCINHAVRDNNEMLEPIVGILIEITRLRKEENSHQILGKIVDEATELYSGGPLFYDILLSHSLYEPELGLWFDCLSRVEFKSKIVDIATSLVSPLTEDAYNRAQSWSILEKFCQLQQHRSELGEFFGKILLSWSAAARRDGFLYENDRMSEFCREFSRHIMKDSDLYTVLSRDETDEFICSFYQASCNHALYSNELNLMLKKSFPSNSSVCLNLTRKVLVKIFNDIFTSFNIDCARDAKHLVGRVVDLVMSIKSVSPLLVNILLQELPSETVWKNTINRMNPYLLRHFFYKKLYCLPELWGSSSENDNKTYEQDSMTFLAELNSLSLASVASYAIIEQICDGSSIPAGLLKWILVSKSTIQLSKFTKAGAYLDIQSYALGQIDSSISKSIDLFETSTKIQVVDELFKLSLTESFPYSYSLSDAITLFQSAQHQQDIAKKINKIKSSILQLDKESLNVHRIVLFDVCGNHVADDNLYESLRSICDGMLASEGRSADDNQTTYLINAMTSCIKHIRDKSELFETIYPVLSMINDLRSSQSESKRLDELNLNEIGLASALVDLYRALIEHLCTELSLIEWDLILVSITKNIGMMLDSKDSLLEGVFQPIFATRVLDLVYDLTNLAKQWQQMIIEGDSSQTFPLMEKLCEEWVEFHSSAVYFGMIVIFLDLANRHPLNERDLITIASISRIVINVKPEIIWENSSLLPDVDSQLFDVQMTKPCRFSVLPAERYNGFNNLCLMLTSNYRSVVVSASHMLTSLMPNVCEEIMRSSNTNEEISSHETDDRGLLPPLTAPKPLMALLARTDSMVAILLNEFRVGDVSVCIEPGTYAYTCTIAYFLVWHHILGFTKGVSMDIAQQSSAYLQETGFVQRLLDNIFKLVPSINDCRETFDSDEELAKFLRSPLAIDFESRPNEIALLALHTYFEASLRMPVTIKMWFNNLNKRVSDLVNKYTTKFISPVICALELELIQEQRSELMSNDRFKNMTIKARPTAREIVAQYTREFNLELVIKMPENYPLGPVIVDGKHVGVSDALWRNWLLRLTTFLTHQNGDILDGIEIWKRNIDKRFEGVEECMICYSILANQKLPKLKCKYCAKLFHSYCLYRWFVSSSNSTCPLCRNLW